MSEREVEEQTFRKVCSNAEGQETVCFVSLRKLKNRAKDRFQDTVLYIVVRSASALGRQSCQFCTALLVCHLAN
jgi:hypothetical protein